MNHKTIHAPNAPKALGPYSHAVSAGGFVFTSGQIGIDPASGAMAGEDIKRQTHQVFSNLKSVLNAAGLTLENVVKTMVFLSNMADFSAMNEIYATYFTDNPPARSCVQAAALPGGAKVEIEVIAQGGGASFL